MIIKTVNGTTLFGDEHVTIVNDNHIIYEPPTCIVNIHGYFSEGIFVPHSEEQPAWTWRSFEFPLIKQTNLFLLHGKHTLRESITDDPILKMVIQLKWGHLVIHASQGNDYVYV